MRVADADREQLVAELREHALAGRLSSEELEERVGKAYSAITRADLDAIRADLPVSSTSVALALRKRKGQLRRRLAQEAGGGIGVSALSVGIWLLTGGHHGHAEFWPAWVIGATMLPVVRDSWRLFGPGSDLEVVHARLQARHERRLTRAQRHRYRGLPR
jgi:asparagine synthetase A